MSYDARLGLSTALLIFSWIMLVKLMFDTRDMNKAIDNLDKRLRDIEFNEVCPPLPEEADSE